MAQKATIRLYGDNAGGLYLWHVEGQRGYSGLEASSALFVADAPALATGDTRDWTVPEIDEQPRVAGPNEDGTRLLATWSVDDLARYEDAEEFPAIEILDLGGGSGRLYLRDLDVQHDPCEDCDGEAVSLDEVRPATHLIAGRSLCVAHAEIELSRRA